LTESRGPGRCVSAPSGEEQEDPAGDAAPPGRRPCAALADPRPVTRLALRHALARAGIEVVDEAGDAAGALRAVQARRPDVCLIDAHLPGALAAVRQSTACAPETRVVVLFESRADHLLVEALRAGATGCLYKDTAPEALGRAVRATLEGEAPLPRSATRRVIEELRDGAPDERRVRTASGAWTRLSRRESEVLELLRQELSTSEIAERLGISAVTVRRHVSGTLRRLGARDRDSALRLAAGHPVAEQRT
jgi:two-component system, NarL family, nitrate/nitrite response regulator NarL